VLHTDRPDSGEIHRYACIHTQAVIKHSNSSKSLLDAWPSVCLHSQILEQGYPIIDASFITLVDVMTTNSADLVVISHHHPSSLQLLTLIGAQQQVHDSNLHVWSVDNKYYTANIPCHATTLSAANDCTDCEAMVMVFDPAKQETFKQVQAWYQKRDNYTAEIRLVVAMYEDTHEYMREGSRQQWLQAAEDWCTEQMIEYVELCSVSPDTVRSHSSEEGAQGLARVVEALQSHMWPCAEMRQQQGQQGPAAGAAAAMAVATAAAAAAAAQEAVAPVDTKALPDQLSLPEPEDDEDDATLAAFERLMADMQGAQDAVLHSWLLVLFWMHAACMHLRKLHLFTDNKHRCTASAVSRL
jgi:hypothetical protein